jgi:ferrous iron transport protein B
VSQVLDLGLPTVVVLNMSDVAVSRGIQINTAALSRRLGLPVVTTEAHRKRGLDELRATIVAAAVIPPVERPRIFPASFAAECERLSERLASLGQPETPYYLLERLLLDIGGYLEGISSTGRPACSQCTFPKPGTGWPNRG